jgi:hypothetical protein
MTALEIAGIIEREYDPARETVLEFCDRRFRRESAQAVIDAISLCLARLRRGAVQSQLSGGR